MKILRGQLQIYRCSRIPQKPRHSVPCRLDLDTGAVLPDGHIPSSYYSFEEDAFRFIPDNTRVYFEAEGIAGLGPSGAKGIGLNSEALEFAQRYAARTEQKQLDDQTPRLETPPVLGRRL
jgi:hypothetical protein